HFLHFQSLPSEYCSQYTEGVFLVGKWLYSIFRNWSLLVYRFQEDKPPGFPLPALTAEIPKGPA
ncbi:hypothetical protein M3557_16270, partial [Bhargavaea ginsengi]|uniref:hypothetical protein n=1 Tax=Bhargavaea ginsengi TaxID=426757 RepID=UPI00203C7B58